MKVLIILIAVSQFVLMGCKQEVGFNAIESSERPFGPPPTGSQVVGPTVKILKAPVDQLLGEEHEVVFEVLAGDNKIEDISCWVGLAEVPCDGEKGILSLMADELGPHTLNIVAVDEKGLEGEAKDSWTVYDRFKRFRDNINVSRHKKSDILFVIDNSTSMRREQTQISQRFANFIEQIRGLDWHLGITTTDSRNTEEWADGRLHAFSNGDYYLTPALGEQQAQDLFAHHVRRRESGSDTEMGIYGTYRSIERATNPFSEVDHALAQFFRSDAALSVVVVSDEDESADTSKNDGDNLISLIEDRWGRNKIFQFNSIIVNSRECERGEGVTYGEKYERLSNKTNGIVGDICANNYSQILKDIGQGVSNLQKVHNLKCTPQDIDRDGQIDLTITPKGNNKVPGYVIDGRRVEFDQALNTGGYEFHYFCLN